MPAPVVSDLDPDSGTQGSMVEVTITGENFSGTAVNVSGTGVTVPVISAVDSPTQITAFNSFCPALLATRNLSQ